MLVFFNNLESKSKNVIEDKVFELCYTIDSLSRINDSLCKVELDRFYEFIKPISNSEYFSYYYRRIGLYHYRNENYLKAIEFYSQSVKLSETISDSWSLASDYSNIGDVYFAMKEFDKALLLYQKSNVYYSYIENVPFFDGFIKYQLAKTYYARDEFHLAIGFAIEAMPLLESNSNYSKEINDEKYRAEYLFKNHLLLSRLYLNNKLYDKMSLHLKQGYFYMFIR